MSDTVDPSRILDAGFGFWSSKVLLTAIEIEVFTVLNGKKMTGEELGNKLGLHPRGIWDFFDILGALKFLERDGNGREARYRNTAGAKKQGSKATKSSISPAPAALPSLIVRMHVVNGVFVAVGRDIKDSMIMEK